MKQTIKEIFDLQKTHSLHLRTTSSAERKAKLRKLKSLIEASEAPLFEALQRDLRKSEFEAALSELYIVYSEIDFAIKNLDRWIKPRRVPVTLSSLLTRNRIYYEPKGVCLIISPWNYPFQLLIGPLVSAIAGGNCAMLKPSELSSHTSSVLTRMINENFESSEVACFEGDATCAQELLTLPFDHIFFTGSTEVGKKVMAAAAKNLSPVTLELGGKSPVIIDENVSLEKVVEKIMWGKFINAGQTCISPDYVLLRAEQQDEFLALCRSVLKNMFYLSGSLDENSYGKIISKQHYERLNGLLKQAVNEGAQIEIGGGSDDEKQIIEPTVVSNVNRHSAVMQEEIFGPILPVISYESLEEAIRFINDRPKPLALYIFSGDDSTAESIIKRTSAGGTTVNDIAIHFANSFLPFGGVGTSGMGSSHGFYGFKAFSHERAVTFQAGIDFNRLAYPPYGKKKGLLKWLKKVM